MPLDNIINIVRTRISTFGLVERIPMHAASSRRIHSWIDDIPLINGANVRVCEHQHLPAFTVHWVDYLQRRRQICLADHKILSAAFKWRVQAFAAHCVRTLGTVDVGKITRVPRKSTNSHFVHNSRSH